MNDYWKNIRTTHKTLKTGLKITARHLKAARNSRNPMSPKNENYFDQQNGIMTTQYPKEVIPVPHHGRYKLHNEIDDCIVCDKCAKICPVDCIDIEPIRSPEEFGKTSDGTPKRIYAARFDIDMAKCCFCGLCTTVCPTECLTMTDEYDFSEFDYKEHNFEFGEMTPLEILEKKKAFEEYTAKKEAEKKTKVESSPKSKIPIKPKIGGGPAKPAMKPKISGASASKPKIPIRPRIPKKDDGESNQNLDKD